MRCGKRRQEDALDGDRSAADVPDPNGPPVPVENISAPRRGKAITVAVGGMVFMAISAAAGCIRGAILPSQLEWERQQAEMQQAAEEDAEHEQPAITDEMD